MTRKFLFFILAVIALTVFSSSVIIYLRKETPLEYLNAARDKISAAEKKKSLAYAKVPFQQARIYYDSAMHYWQSENVKWFFQRDFQKAIASAEKSSKYADEALSRAKKSTKEIESILARQIEDLNKTVSHYNATYKKVPLSSSQTKEWTRGRILLEEGILAYKNKEFLKAVEKLDSAAVLIHKVYEYPQNLMESYFDKLAKWQDQEEDLIKASRKHKNTCLVVDKYNRILKVYKNGQLHTTYEVDLGPNWIGDKSHQGDKATPEGHYKILKKKDGKDTKYYKALLLDYPNEDDKEEFEEKKKEGLIKATAKIGGLIEIHGNGGKGADWTEGCVALRDKDMDKLFSLCRPGTEVLIVGSLTSLNKRTQ